MQLELVLFISPDLEETVRSALEGSERWHYTIYSTGPNRKESLNDVQRLAELLSGADTCFIATHTDFSADARVEVSVTDFDNPQLMDIDVLDETVYRSGDMRPAHLLQYDPFLQEGMAIGQACKRAGVKNIVLSSHLHCEKTIGIPAKHYDAKAEIYTYVRHTLELPITMVNIPPVYEMFCGFLCPTPTPDGQFEVVFPAVGPASIDFIASADIGMCLMPVFDHPEVFRGKTVALVGDKLTGKMVLTILNDVLSPMTFVERQVTMQEVRDRPVPGAIDVANMFEFLGRADLKSSLNGTKELHPMIENFRCWLAGNKEILAAASINNIPHTDNMAAII